MMNQDEINYLNTFLLKTGERLDFTNKKPINDHLIELKIIKQTERTYRVVGLLTIPNTDKKDEPFIVDEELLRLGLTPKKKIKLNEYERNTVNWFNHGFLLQEIRLKKDGKTPDSQHYRMGYRLFKYQQDELLAQEIKIDQEFNSWKSMGLTLDQLPTPLISIQRERGYKSCLSIINKICQHNAHELKELPDFPTRWSYSKRLKFLHFSSAFLQLCSQKNEFDWKEIGASYYKEIGGSKKFDQYKDEYINLLEEWSQCPLALLGMTSLGKITPLYFSGQITGQFSSYQYGPVHSLTDLAISEEAFTTDSKTLWLVENRAILTRLAAEKNFLEETKSLVLCLDGHLRSSHKNCIKQLLTTGKINQVLIWSDYDPDGLQIAKEAYFTVSEIHQGSIKWITHNREALKNWQEYEEYMLELLKENRMEQELILGGAYDWRKWINH